MNREEVNYILKNNEILPDSKFGQNFLCNDSICDEIIELSGTDSNSTVIEIGPGIGALTRKLVNIAESVTAVEIDKRLASFLKSEEDLNSCNIIVSDYLKLNKEDYEADKYDRVLSNIPYYLMTPIILKLITECTNSKSMTFMIEEAAWARISAKFGTKQYGPLSIMCSLYGEVNKEFNVGRDSFVPQPHTLSCVISLNREESDYKFYPSEEFLVFINAAFSQRRKKLMNSLNSYLKQNNISIEHFIEILKSFGFTENVRAEEINPNQFADIFKSLK